MIKFRGGLAALAAAGALVVGVGLSGCATPGREALPPAATPSAARPPVEKPVPPPSQGSGDIRDKVKEKSITARKPVPLNKSAQVADGITVRIERTKSIKAKATLPGEVAGPGVRFDLVIENDTSKPIDLVAVVVECTDETGAPVNRISSDPAEPFEGVLEPGRSAKGRYVFVIDEKQRDKISLAVTVTGDLPVVRFEGPLG
ncbi:hypothetical protein [Microlunatus parietis]|uniref:DUF4352 domain-containing protein n=1 Tax=Microlunatus parietis TaxID=682979 RepID=A0A7Y9I9Y7_9ACTN|nr:hypothetical protein [Microlunatus parietis]NYE72999.1 hypothetical protein [Microlunatus parietis]